MISRIYLNDLLSFEDVSLEFKKGLIVFSGPSGSGKSILMQAFLSLFGIEECKSSLAEIIIDNHNIFDESFDISKGDEIIIKEIKKEKVRYFLNNQTISKKSLKIFSSKLVRHLHLKDTSDFNNDKIIEFLDKLSIEKFTSFKDIKNNYDISFKKLQILKKELKKLNDDEKEIEDLKEYTKFEIQKIALINPKIDEYEQLNELKRQLSQKEKLEVAVKLAQGFFDYEAHIVKVLNLMQVNSSFFDETINELHNIFELSKDSLNEIEDLDIESTLDRIEMLSSLNKRFGSIQNALDYKKEKEVELEKYENISFEKAIKEKNILKLQVIVDSLAQEIFILRQKSSKILEEKINNYSKLLYLENVSIQLSYKILNNNRYDEVLIKLNETNLDTISSGEFNRLRLALLTAMSEFELVNNGILFLDEIDANLSGKESASIAQVLNELSKTYQIFAISHQAQLTAKANQHFLVDKKNNKSFVKELNKNERIDEISRMISGNNITNEAYNFAKNILNEQ